MTESSISKTERITLTLILSLIILFVGSDLLIDSQKGVGSAHLGIELSLALAAAAGIFILLRDSFRIKHELRTSLQQNSLIQAEALHWKKESAKYIEGLSSAIDAQLERWKLSHAEKEIALLLLKGLSLKEVAEIRQTAEKTVRAQATSLYQKSALSGRSELAAYFLEDLLVTKS